MGRVRDQLRANFGRSQLRIAAALGRMLFADSFELGDFLQGEGEGIWRRLIDHMYFLTK
jgi:hypothetical protein